MTDVADRVLKLRADAERLKAEVVRGEARFEAAEQKVSDVRSQLVEAGFDPDWDLEDQLTKRSADLEIGLAAIQADLVTVQEGAR